MFHTREVNSRPFSRQHFIYFWQYLETIFALTAVTSEQPSIMPSIHNSSVLSARFMLFDKGRHWVPFGWFQRDIFVEMRRVGNQSPVCPDRCVRVAGSEDHRPVTNFRILLFLFSAIMEAAHCENDRESGRPVAVKMGVIYIHDNGSNAQIINVASITSHPDYKGSEKYYDIALIKLKSFIRFDEHVRPACVVTGSEAERKMIAIGFGKTQYGEYRSEGEGRVRRLTYASRKKAIILLCCWKIFFIDSGWLRLSRRWASLYFPSLCNPSFAVHDKGSQHLRKVLLNSVDRQTCIRTYQVIYYFSTLVE